MLPAEMVLHLKVHWEMYQMPNATNPAYETRAV